MFTGVADWYIPTTSFAKKNIVGLTGYLPVATVVIIPEMKENKTSKQETKICKVKRKK